MDVLRPFRGFSMRGTLNPTQSHSRGSSPLQDLVARRAAGVRGSPPLRAARFMAARWRSGGNNPERPELGRNCPTPPRAPRNPIPRMKCAVRYDQEIVMTSCSGDPPATPQVEQAACLPSPSDLKRRRANAIKTAGGEPPKRQPPFTAPPNSARQTVAVSAQRCKFRPTPELRRITSSVARRRSRAWRATKRMPCIVFCYCDEYWREPSNSLYYPPRRAGDGGNS
jgi:hypothetical protein